MLIESKRHTVADLAAWKNHEIMDAAHAARINWSTKAGAAADEVRKFVAAGPCYLGVSWGKDSVVVAHIIASSKIDVPMVWVRIFDRENPECPLVRDEFLRRHPHVRYDEIEVAAATHGLTSSNGFREAALRYGDRHVSGVREVESRVRRIRTRRWGLTTAKTCAPIARWSTDDVFAFLHREGLPVHPAYAYSMGGQLDRNRLRVSSLGGSRGVEMGRAEWERRYYPDVMDALKGMRCR